jgi:hypothetical protein
MPIRLGTTLVLLAGILCLSGCSKKAGPGSASAEREEELRQIGELYTLYLKEKKRPPAKLADLRAYEVPFPEGFQALSTGQCVVLWGVDLTKKKESDANTVLAYDKATPTDGGLVLMKDGKTKILTAEQFQAAPKAKG